MQALIIIMSFLDFIFYPTIVATIIAVIIEQIIRRVGNPEWNQDQQWINRAMGVRKNMNLRSSYSYECKDCTIKRIKERRKNNNNSKVDWTYPDW